MGNTDSNPWIPLTQAFQEIEKIRFSYDLRKNPDDFNRYVTERVDRITKETMDKKRAAFQKAHTDMGRYFDMDHNAGFYKTRNNDLIYLQEQLLERSRTAVSGIKHDKDLTRRQTEINEWYFNDKLETLFFLQMFFIVMLAEAIILYMQKNSIITAPFAAFLTFVLLGVVIGTGLYRNQYTSDTRDGRFWHRRSFREKQIFVATPENKPCNCDDPGSLVPSAASECAKKAKEAAAGAASGAANYASESTKPYGQAALAGLEGAGAGAAQAGAGVAGGLGTAGGAIGGAGRAIGAQALSDSRAVANRAGEAADRAASQLEADTIAYISGDGRSKPKPNKKGACPF
jgi:hypothetical protein